MIPDTVIQELSSIVGPEHLTTHHEDLTKYSSDATKLEFMPDAVAFPGDAEEISRILLLANRGYFPVIPRGAGSGASGGALPVKGGLVLAMDRFNRILCIDQDNLIVKVEPGVITAHLQEEVEKLGLFYPPDPASIHISTIGGNVAECAGGLRAVKYGVTRDYVLSLEIVLPTGEIMKTGVETAKGVVGYDLTRLIVGSEGTLAVITSVTLRLIPKPAFKRTMMAFFHDISSSVRTVSDIIRSKIVPTTLEFMDRLSIDCVRNEMGLPIPDETGALLLIEVDGDEDLTARDVSLVQEICVRSGAILFQAASGKEDAERLWEARRGISPALLKLRPGKVSQDIVVPRSRLPELISFLEQLGQKYKLPIPAFGHAGDGNIHVNIMLDKSLPEEVENANAAVKDLFRKVIEMGGTISGEHGIGVTKAPYMEMEISRPALELMWRLKKAFDPKGILNPGKIFPQSI
ncbi:MAG: FAD-binding protein [Deltaproteobacteria bacterium]|nr:MAG: FAD-binding protein [Deltaproteobacteria bacterium]